MKNFKILFFGLAFLIAGMAFVACTSTSTDTGETTTTAEPDMESKEYASAFICPMHCPGSGSDVAGKCPSCNMDYVANEEHTNDGHDHSGEEENHEGHDHSGEEHDHDVEDGHNH